MKPFSLKAAKAGKKVCTKCGCPARIVCFDVKTQGMLAIMALVDIGIGKEVLGYYKPDGSKYGGSEFTHQRYDLMMVSENHTGWINIYRGTKGDLSRTRIYDTEEKAKKCADKSSCVATVKIEWEEPRYVRE